jgi:hypothetical protein
VLPGPGQAASKQLAHLEGLPYRRAPALRVLRPVFRRIVGDDVRGIVRMLATPP